MKLGLVTYNLGKDFDLPALIEVCRRTGFEGVELRTTHKHGVEPSLTPSQRADVRQRFADSGVTLWGLGTVCEFHSPDQEVVRANVETCARFAELARDVGARGIKVRPNGLPPEVPVEQTVEQIGRALVECGRHAADLGVEVWVEVHGRGSEDPKVMRAVMEACRHPNVGVCWNSNPGEVQNGSVSAAFKLLQPWIRSVHINELPSRAYPWQELFRLLHRSAYDRFTLCECQESSDPTRVLSYYAALWRAMVEDATR
jgi:sugar phosphate isomerase/epimerase